MAKYTTFTSYQGHLQQIIEAHMPNFHRICILQGFKPFSIIKEYDLYFEGHLAVQGLKLAQFRSCSAYNSNEI